MSETGLAIVPVDRDFSIQVNDFLKKDVSREKEKERVKKKVKEVVSVDGSDEASQEHRKQYPAHSQSQFDRSQSLKSSKVLFPSLLANRGPPSSSAATSLRAVAAESVHHQQQALVTGSKVGSDTWWRADEEKRKETAVGFATDDIRRSPSSSSRSLSHSDSHSHSLDHNDDMFESSVYFYSPASSPSPSPMPWHDTLEASPETELATRAESPEISLTKRPKRDKKKSRKSSRRTRVNRQEKSISFRSAQTIHAVVASDEIFEDELTEEQRRQHDSLLEELNEHQHQHHGKIHQASKWQPVDNDSGRTTVPASASSLPALPPLSSSASPPRPHSTVLSSSEVRHTNGFPFAFLYNEENTPRTPRLQEMEREQEPTRVQETAGKDNETLKLEQLERTTAKSVGQSRKNAEPHSNADEVDTRLSLDLMFFPTKTDEDAVLLQARMGLLRSQSDSSSATAAASEAGRAPPHHRHLRSLSDTPTPRPALQPAPPSAVPAKSSLKKPHAPPVATINLTATALADSDATAGNGTPTAPLGSEPLAGSEGSSGELGSGNTKKSVRMNEKVEVWRVYRDEESESEGEEEEEWRKRLARRRMGVMSSSEEEEEEEQGKENEQHQQHKSRVSSTTKKKLSIFHSPSPDFRQLPPQRPPPSDSNARRAVRKNLMAPTAEQHLKLPSPPLSVAMLRSLSPQLRARSAPRSPHSPADDDNSELVQTTVTFTQRPVVPESWSAARPPLPPTLDLDASAPGNQADYIEEMPEEQADATAASDESRPALHDLFQRAAIIHAVVPSEEEDDGEAESESWMAQRQPAPKKPHAAASDMGGSLRSFSADDMQPRTLGHAASLPSLSAARQQFQRKSSPVPVPAIEVAASIQTADDIPDSLRYLFLAADSGSLLSSVPRGYRTVFASCSDLDALTAANLSCPCLAFFVYVSQRWQLIFRTEFQSRALAPKFKKFYLSKNLDESGAAHLPLKIICAHRNPTVRLTAADEWQQLAALGNAVSPSASGAATSAAAMAVIGEHVCSFYSIVPEPKNPAVFPLFHQAKARMNMKRLHAGRVIIACAQQRTTPAHAAPSSASVVTTASDGRRMKKAKSAVFISSNAATGEPSQKRREQARSLFARLSPIAQPQPHALPHSHSDGTQPERRLRQHPHPYAADQMQLPAQTAAFGKLERRRAESVGGKKKSLRPLSGPIRNAPPVVYREEKLLSDTTAATGGAARRSSEPGSVDSQAPPPSFESSPLDESPPRSAELSQPAMQSSSAPHSMDLGGEHPQSSSTF